MDSARRRRRWIIGAALAFGIYKNKIRTINPDDSTKGSFLGNEYSQNEIEKELKSIDAKFKTYTMRK